ncbi:MAG: hypothetical protein BroJett014_27890 [Planctomycetota bacterium]|nr:MAG: hypothetical protein BroJett014_27890 [Planctomycetota bacterium]
MKLPGVQLALLILIAMGRHSELETVGNSRQSRDQAMAQLWKKGHLELRDGLPQVSRAIMKKVEDYICSLRSELFAVRLPGPELGRPPAFDWDSLSVVQSQYLLAALTEAATMECVARFRSSISEVRELLSRFSVPDFRARVIGMARLLHRMRNLNALYSRLGPGACISGAMNPNMSGFAEIKDPRTVLADWLANSDLAEAFPPFAFPAAAASSPERNEAGITTSESAGAAAEPIGMHAPELTTANDPGEATELISATPIGGAAPTASPSPTAIAAGAARDEAAATGVDASTQPPLPS